MTQSDFTHESNEFISALTAIHIATPGGYTPPQDVAAAQAASDDLVDRVRAKDWDWSRDERRLAKRYDSIKTAHEDRILAEWRSKRAASTPPELEQ